MAQAKIETIKQTEEIGLFTIRFEGDIATEFEKFANKFKDDAKRQADLQIILNTLNRMLENGAALERYFRYEGKMSDNVVALPTFRTSLRLYCLRMSDSVLIVGNGGEKNTKTYEESAELNGYVISLQKLDELLKQEIASGSVVIEKANIVGADEKLFDL